MVRLELCPSCCHGRRQKEELSVVERIDEGVEDQPM